MKRAKFFFSPLFDAINGVLFEDIKQTNYPPFIRSSVNLKKWMLIVIIALIPATFFAIFNLGIQSLIYSSNIEYYNLYITASATLRDYLLFCLKDFLFLKAFLNGFHIFLPILFFSYLIGGFWEVLFALVRKKPISEGFFVTGLLFALILPSTIPYWMLAVGISLGIILSKEIFGGTGMNVFNPALIARCILYFAYPAYLTGNVWVGANPYSNQIDGVSEQTALSVYNIPYSIKRIHLDAISRRNDQQFLNSIDNNFLLWKQKRKVNKTFQTLSNKELKSFVTSSLNEHGLGLDENQYKMAKEFIDLKNGKNLFSNFNLFIGNKIGSIGEVSILACLFGALILLFSRIGSFRIMFSFCLGIIITSLLFEFLSKNVGKDFGLWNAGIFDFPFYKHFLMGGLSFGIIFMATDPVSSPYMNLAKWLYGFIGGFLVIAIRTLNPAYPEGIMLAIIFINIFAPLLDHYSTTLYRRKKYREI